MRPEYKLTDRKLWASRLLACKKKDKLDRNWSEKDAIGLVNDRKLFPKKTHNKLGKPNWHGSAAEEQLSKDIAKVGDKPAVKPSILWSQDDRKCYKEFDLPTFRKHIYQRQKTLKYHNWRNEEAKLPKDPKERKRLKAKAKKEAKKKRMEQTNRSTEM